MPICRTCSSAVGPEDLYPYNFHADSQSPYRVTGTTYMCSRCLSNRAPDAYHFEIVRSEIPECIAAAFADEAEVNPEQCGAVDAETGEICRTKTLAGGRCMRHSADQVPPTAPDDGGYRD